MTWLAEDRAGLATERILAAAGRVSAAQGPTGLSMDTVAREAGCSRATLYRYFENRHALLTAYAHRQARNIIDLVSNDIADVSDPSERATQAVLACLREVRARPDLLAWYGSGDTRFLAEIIHESPLIEAITARFVSSKEGSSDVARWVLRAILSLLAVPGQDTDEELRMVSQFLTPHMSIR